MSKTIRRKNYERSLLRNTPYSKSYGFYGKRTYRHGVYNINNRYLVYYEPLTNKADINERWREFHGESKSANYRTPSRFYRNMYESKLRVHNKRQLHKVMHNDETYLFYNTPESHMWAWD